MKAISDPAYVMKWEAPEFMDYLLGELPKVRKYQKDKKVEDEIASLEKVLTTYDAFSSEKASATSSPIPRSAASSNDLSVALVIGQK